MEELAEVFGLLSDVGRLRILLHLRSGPLSVTDIATAAGLSQSATSHALRLLRAHRIVAAERHGRQVMYQLADEHVSDVLTLAIEHLDHEHPHHSHAPEL